MEYLFNDEKYIILKDESNIFDYELLKEKVTDYYKDFDYILIDQSYNKFRLKGFNDEDNKNFRKINDFKLIDDYISNYCSYGCKYIILKKVKNSKTV